MLVNRFDYNSLRRFFYSGKKVIVNHYEMGNGYIHKIDDQRKIIFFLLDGDMFAFADEGNPEKEIFPIDIAEMAIFLSD